MNNIRIVAKKITAALAAASLFAAFPSATLAAPDTTAQSAPAKAVRVIDFTKAMELAIKENSNLKTLEENLAVLTEDRNRAHSLGIGISTDNDLDSKLSYAITVSNIRASIAEARYDQELTEKSIEYALKNTFTSIKASQEDLAFAKKQYGYQQASLEQTQIKHNLGLVSTNAYDKEKKSLEKLKLSIEKIQKNIDSLYHSLSYLLGIENDGSFSITYLTPEFKPLDINFDINGYVDLKLSTDPYLKKLREVADASETAEKYQSTSSAKSDNRTHKEAVQDTELAMRNLYTDIRALENTIIINRNALEKANHEYNTLKVLYDAGQIAKHALDGAALSQAQAQYTLDKNYITHDMYLFELEYPYTISQKSGGN